MTPLEAILELLARVGASDGGAVLVSETELASWPESVANAMKREKLLVKARPGGSVICPGCERQCAMQVHTVPDGTGNAASFVLCDKRDAYFFRAVAAMAMRCGDRRRVCCAQTGDAT
jgi:hypothetical protein